MSRVSRVNQLIKKELSQIIFREVDFPAGVFVTLTRVETSADLQEAKAYISVMPENINRQILDTLKRRIYFLQQSLNKRLKIRPLPRIIFTEEKATAQAGRIEELLEEIHRKISND